MAKKKPVTKPIEFTKYEIRVLKMAVVEVHKEGIILSKTFRGIYSKLLSAE